MDYDLGTAALQDFEKAKTFIGKEISALPVPAFLINRDVLKANAARFRTKLANLNKCVEDHNNNSSSSSKEDNVHKINPIKFRTHVKTLKTIEATRAALGYPLDSSEPSETASKAVVVSTMAELRGLLPLIRAGQVTDVIYGVPISKSHLAEVEILQQFGATISVFVDNVEQLEILSHGGNNSSTNTENKGIVWPVMIKIDADEHRAGAQIESEEFEELVKGIEKDGGKQFLLRGFYAHAGASYDASSLEQVQAHLSREINAVTKAAARARKLLGDDKEVSFLLSIGATPTMNALSKTDDGELLSAIFELKQVDGSSTTPHLANLTSVHSNDTLELHAGNFVALDLQQVSTSLARYEDIAGTCLTEIVSYYKNRSTLPGKYNKKRTHAQQEDDTTEITKGPEYLINAGVLALTREPPHGDEYTIKASRGLAQVVGNTEWIVTRVSQEHGILEFSGTITENTDLKPWKHGDKIQLYPQHMCISAAMHKFYFVVSGTTVVDVWKPWKFW